MEDSSVSFFPIHVKLNRMRILFYLALVLLPVSSWAKDLCDILKIQNCPTVMKQSRRSSMQSLPSPTTAAALNPSNVSFDRGIGAEFIYQPGNAVNWGVVTGTGKVGGALISSSVENGFFGNRTVETDFKYGERNEEQKQYESKKLNLAVGGRALGKRNYTLDLGILLKRHKDIKDINLGFGASARLGFLTLGASLYQDDFILRAVDSDNTLDDRYKNVFLGPTYTERFQVQTLSAGLRIDNFSIDTGWISTKYKFHEEDSKVQLIALSYAHKNLLFNFARRVENSPMPKYEDGHLVYQEEATNYYASVQVSMGKHLILGTAYNYFLLREVSLNATVFF